MIEVLLIGFIFFIVLELIVIVIEMVFGKMD